MRSNYSLILGIVTVALFHTSRIEAAPIEIQWTGETIFDNDEILFPAFETDRLTAISGNGRYNAGLIGGGADFFMDVRLDGVWTEIWSEHVDFALQGELDDLVANSSDPFPISFSTGMVDGLRLRSTPPIGADRHYSQWGIDDGFQFNDASAVPEPSSLALLATGALGFMGYGWRRKRKLAA